MVKLVCAVGVLAAATGAAIGAVAPAVADDPAPEGTLEGFYTYRQEGGPTVTWKITPVCVPTVGDGRVPLELAVGCKLQVEGQGTQSGAYRLVGGRWTFSTPLLGGMTCPDGKAVATTETYQFDTSLNGTYSQGHNAVCGLQPAIDRHPFTLTYLGPLDVPSVKYPLTCQDNPLHLCS